MRKFLKPKHKTYVQASHLSEAVLNKYQNIGLT